MLLPNYKEAKLRNKENVIREEYEFNNDFKSIGTNTITFLPKEFKNSANFSPIISRRKTW